MTSPRIPRRPLVAALALAAAGTLSSCTPVQAGAAATVGDERITVSAVQDATEQVIEERDDAGQADTANGDLQRSLLNHMVYAEVFDEAARRLDVPVTEAEIDKVIDDQRKAVGEERFEEERLKQGVPSSMLRPVVRYNIAYGKISETLVPVVTTEQQAQEREDETLEYLLDVADDLGVSTNPRYGTWDPETFVINKAESALSKPESAFEETSS